MRQFPALVCLTAMVLAGCGGERDLEGERAAQANDAVQRDPQRETVESIPSSPSAAEPTTSTTAVEANAASDQWPRWSGPNADLISREQGWSANWPDAGLPVVWEANVGTGFSSVSIAAGKLYTMGHRDGRDVVYCLDAITGEEIWTHDYACELVDRLHEGGPGSTPTIDNGRVYTVSRQGHLFCLDAANGDVVWSGQLEKLTGVEYPEWGFTCSPLVLGDMLIIEAGRLIALNKNDGEKIWQTKIDRPGYGSPVAFKREGQQLLTVLNNDRLLIVRAMDGSEVASFDWETSFATSSTTPIVIDDKIFISTGYNRGCALLRLAGDELELIYENREMRNHMNNSVLWEGHLYGIDGNSHTSRLCQLVCLEVATGTRKWSEGGFGCGSLMIADGKLLVLSDGGTLAVAQATPDGYDEISRADLLDGRCWTVPVLLDGRVYCRDARGKLVCARLPKQPRE